MKTKPTKTEMIATGIYAGGTAILYTETVYTLLCPLMRSLLESQASDMSEESKENLSSLISYGVLLPFLVILGKTQYRSYQRAIEEYNRQCDDSSDAVQKQPSSKATSTIAAIFKSIATGTAAWSMFRKVPEVGLFTGVVASVTAFVGSFFTQRKFLALYRMPSSPTETTALFVSENDAHNGL